MDKISIFIEQTAILAEKEGMVVKDFEVENEIVEIDEVWSCY